MPTYTWPHTEHLLGTYSFLSILPKLDLVTIYDLVQSDEAIEAEMHCGCQKKIQYLD